MLISRSIHLVLPSPGLIQKPDLFLPNPSHPHTSAVPVPFSRARSLGTSWSGVSCCTSGPQLPSSSAAPVPVWTRAICCPVWHHFSPSPSSLCTILTSVSEPAPAHIKSFVCWSRAYCLWASPVAGQRVQELLDLKTKRANTVKVSWWRKRCLWTTNPIMRSAEFVPRMRAMWGAGTRADAPLCEMAL